jgi:hypothetical protein
MTSSFNQLGKHPKPDAHRERQKALTCDSDKLSERLLDAWGQWAFGVHVGLTGRYGFLHGGPPCDLGDRLERCQRQRTKREDRRLQVLQAMGQPRNP